MSQAPSETYRRLDKFFDDLMIAATPLDAPSAKMPH